MPFSDVENRDWSVKQIQSAKPRLIYDIGPGVGTYADALRPVLPNTVLHGIEIWEPYIAKYKLLSKYDVVTVADARTFDFPRGDYTVIMGDVLEHMPEADGRQLVATIKERAAHFMLSVPVLHKDQGAVFGNPFEAHVRHWSADELSKLMGPCPSVVGRVLARYWWSR